jgi:hypothetical protein
MFIPSSMVSKSRSKERLAVPNNRKAVFLHISPRLATVAVKNMVAKQLEAFSVSSNRLSDEPSKRDRHNFRQLSAAGLEVVGKLVKEALKASNITG